jgi:hypothetical protein
MIAATNLDEDRRRIRLSYSKDEDNALLPPPILLW